MLCGYLHGTADTSRDQKCTVSGAEAIGSCGIPAVSAGNQTCFCSVNSYTLGHLSSCTFLTFVRCQVITNREESQCYTELVLKVQLRFTKQKTRRWTTVEREINGRSSKGSPVRSQKTTVISTCMSGTVNAQKKLHVVFSTRTLIRSEGLYISLLPLLENVIFPNELGRIISRVLPQ